jgi:hypothetical protein
MQHSCRKRDGEASFLLPPRCRVRVRPEVRAALSAQALGTGLVAVSIQCRLGRSDGESVRVGSRQGSMRDGVGVGPSCVERAWPGSQPAGVHQRLCGGRYASRGIRCGIAAGGGVVARTGATLGGQRARISRAIVTPPRSGLRCRVSGWRAVRIGAARRPSSSPWISLRLAPSWPGAATVSFALNAAEYLVRPAIRSTVGDHPGSGGPGPFRRPQQGAPTVRRSLRLSRSRSGSAP